MLYSESDAGQGHSPNFVLQEIKGVLTPVPVVYIHAGYGEQAQPEPETKAAA